MGAKSYFRLNSMWRKGATLAALISLLGSALTFLETPPPAAAALVSNNLVLNLDASNASSLAATGATGWNSVSPASSTATSTFFGNAARVSDSTGASMSMDGTGDAAVFPAGTARTAGALTLETWVKPGNLRTGWNVFASRWFPSTARGGSASDQDWHLSIYGTSASNLKFQLNTSAGLLTSTTTFPATSANKWYHLAVTTDASNNTTLWVNGVAETTSANFPHTDNATAQLHIGDVGDATQNSAFNGNMSRFRIYNAALTPAQMAQNYLTDSARYGYAPANTVAPSISGTARVGTALTTPGGTWGVGDADGTTTAYQWQTSTDSTTWTNISGATSASYTPVAGDATNFLRVNVTKTNTAGSATATSASTLRVQTSSGISILSGSKLTGFTSTVPNDGTTYNVTLATNNLAATMRLGTTTGLTLINGYASTASFMASTIGASAPIISFRGTGTAINTALANVTYTSATQQTDVVKLYYATAGTTTTDTKDYIPIYDNNQLKFHYYAYKVHAAGKNRADMDASVAPLGPTDGVEAPGPWYLTTPRYQVEWDRIKLIVGQNQSFMGARADSGSTNWYWPANTDGYTSATIFGTQSGSTVTATSNIFNQTNTTLPYHTGEPNGGTSVGRTGFFYINNNQLGWDDTFLDNSAVPSFTMETYGTAPFNTGSTGVLTQTVNVAASNADAPTGFTAAAAGTDSIAMGWNLTSANTTGVTITGYRMEASTTSNFTSIVASSTPSTFKAGRISGLAANTLYYVRVLAMTSAGNGPSTSPIAVTTTATATTITVVSSGGGIEGTDYSLIDGFFVPKSGLSVSINASAIQTVLGSTAVTLAADNVVVNAPIVWNLFTHLTLGNSSTSNVSVNQSITANSANAWIHIPPSTYSLDVKSGARINFPAAGTSNRLYVGGTMHTVLKSEADLATVVAGGSYALGNSITLATSYTTSPISQIFSGTFDGLGNRISALKLATGVAGNYGLFNSITAGGVIRNLGVTNADITLGGNDYRVGVIAGVSTGGTIDQVWSTGFIRTTTTNSSLALGGLVGNAPSGTTNISRSWSSVNIDSSTSGVNTKLEQGGIIGGNELNVGQEFHLSGGSINLSQVYATGTLKWASNSHRGIGGLMGLHYANATTTITDAFSWVTFASGVPTNNRAGIIGVAAGGTSTATRTYQTTFSECVAGGGSGFTATPNCATMRVPGETVSGISGANWASTGPSILVNLAAPAKPLYVQVVAPTDGSYATVSYQIVDGSGALQNTAALSALNLSVSGTPVYRAAGVVLNASSAKATYSTYYDTGLTLGGSSAGSYSLNPWRENTSVTISKLAQTVTWAPTTSVSFGSGTFTPSPAPVASGGTTITYSVSSAGTTGCTVNASTGAITYTRGGSCAITATAASAGDWLVASDTETFVIAEPATAPTGLAATTAGSGMLNIGWAAPTVSSSAAITGYTLTYSTNAGMTSPTAVNVGNTRGYLLTGLTSGTVYYFQVRAVSGSTWTGPLSTIASATPNSTATTINVVASGGGTAGTDYTINGGVISTTGTASINASVISNLLATEGNVQVAATNVNVNAAISWSANSVLVLGNTSAATVNVNSTIAGSGNTAGVSILASSYGLLVKSGAHIRLTGTTPSFNLGGTSYTVINTVAGLSNVVAGSTWALTAPITLTAAYTTAVRDVTFTGIMDGLGNTISNMDITATVTRNAGFYAALGGATVRNVGFTNVNIKSPTGGIDTRLGSVAGNGSSAGTNTVTQVWATGFINQTSSADSTRTEAGGLFGGATAGTLNISRSWSSVSISTNSPGVGSGGIIGTNVSTFGGAAGVGNALSVSESYSTGNILRTLPSSAGWYGNGGIIGVAYGLSTTINNVFSWGNINSSGTQAGTSVAGIVGVTTNATVANSYTTSATIGVASPTNSVVNVTAGTAPATGTGFGTGVWSTVNGASLVNLTPPTKLLYVRVKAPTDGSFGTVGTEIVDSTGTVQTLSSLNLSVSGTPVFDTISSSTAKGTYSANYASGLTLGGSSAGVYSLGAWITSTSVTISKFPQTITWGPNTSVNFGNGTLTPSASATASGGTTISYAVSTAGTTGCTVSSSTGVITYTSAGTCTVTATAANAGDFLAASTSVAFVIGAAPTLTVVATGGGTAGTDFVLSGGVLSASANASINASYLTTQLASGNVTLAGNVVVNTPITWSGNFVLTLGGTSTNSVAVNSSITGSGNTAGLVIRPSTYSLSTKDGAVISLSGTNPTLSIGGNSYTLIKSIAELSNVTATAGTFWALAKPLAYATSITASPINVNFSGTFDGLGNTVNNMRLTSAATDTGVGFIKKLTGGTVRNLGITNSIISLEPTGTTSILNAGGLVGDSEGGTLDQVWTTGFMQVKEGSTYSGLTMGGLVGDVYSGTLNITKSWSALNLNGWGSTYTNLATGGIVGGTFGTWSATGTTAGGTVNMSQVYSLGDIANPNTTGSLSGLGGILGVHTGTGTVSIVDSFSWSQARFFTGAVYGGIVGIGNGGAITLTNYRTILAQDFTSTGTSSRTITNGFINAAFGGSNATLEALPNWYASPQGVALRNLPVPYKNFYVRVIAPTDGSYNTLSYRMTNGVGVNLTPSNYSLTISGTPTYSEDSDVEISATPYNVDYVSGLTFTYNGALSNVYQFAAYPYSTSVTISKYSQSITTTSTAPTTAAVGSTYTPTATASSSLAVTFTIDASSSSVCTISNGVVTFNALGDCVINANQAGNTSYLAAAQVQQTAKATVKGTQTVSFTSTAPSAKVNGSTYTPTGTATSGLSSVITVNSGSSAICSIASGVVSFAANGSCVLNINQAGNANWNPATQVQQTIAVGKGDQTITFSSTAPASAVVSGSTYTPSATATSAGVVAFTIDAASSAVCSIASGVVSFQAVGTCKVLANQAGNTNWNAATQIFQSFSVGKGTPTLAFTSTAAAPKVGTTYTPAASSASTGVVTYTIDGTTSSICSIASGVVTFNAVGTCKVNAAQATDTNWVAVSQTQQSITVAKGDQTITFSSTPATPKVNSSYTPVATSTSGGAVVFTIDSASSSVCTISLGIVIFSAVGTCTVNANQAGGTNWNAATQVQQTVTVAKGDQTITFSSTAPASAVVSGATYSPTATATGSGTVAFTIDAASSAVCSIASGAVSFQAVGTCKVLANQAGNTNWNAATEGFQSFSVGKGTPTLVFTSTASSPKVNTTYTPVASSASTGAVTYTIDGTTSSICSIASGVVTFNAVGTCKVNAAQATDTNWVAVTQTQQSITVAKGDQTISYTNNPAVPRVNTTYSPTATVTGGGTVTYTIAAASSAICTIAAGVVTFNAVGSCVILADSVATTNWNAATQATKTVTVQKGNQTINFTSTAPTSAVVSGATYTPTATSTSGGSVAFTIDAASTLVCSIAAGVVSFQTVGTCKVLANQAGNTNWNAATENFQSFSVGKGTPTLAFTSTAANPKVNTTYTPVASSSGTGAVSYTIDATSSSICSISAGVVTFNAVGTCKVNAAQATDTNWFAVTQTQQSITTVKGDQTITFTSTAPASAVVSGATYTPTATSTSAGLVSFTVDSASSAVCSIASGVVSFQSAGTCKVLANQAGDTNWNSATQSFQSFSVGKGSQTALVLVAGQSSFNYNPVTPATTTISTYGGSGTGTLSYSVASSSVEICSLSGVTVTALRAGTCVIQATKMGDLNYLDQVVSITIQVNRINQSGFVVSAADPTLDYQVGPAATTTLSTSGGSGTGTVSYLVQVGSNTVCSISGDTVSVLSAGDCVIVATKAADDNYEVAADILTIVVNKIAQVSLKVEAQDATLTHLSSPAATTTLSTIGGSGTGAISYLVAAESATVCSVSGNTVTALTPGVCVLNATKASDINYLVATDETRITVVKAIQSQLTASASSASINYRAELAATTTLTTTGGSGTGAISYTVDSDSSSVCSVDGNTLTALSAGQCVIEATKAADTDYLEASTQLTVTVNKIIQSGFDVTVSDSNLTYSASPLVTTTVAATGGNGLGSVSISVAESSNSVCSLSGSLLTALTAGDCVIVATKAADTNYFQASESVTVTISKASQAPLVITATRTTLSVIGGLTTSTLSFTGGTGTGASSWGIDPRSLDNCSLSGVTVTAVAVGECLVVLTKLGDTNYQSVSQSVVIVVVAAIQETVSLVSSVTSLTFDGEELSRATVTFSGGTGAGLVSFESLTPELCVVGSGRIVDAGIEATVVALHAGTCQVVAIKAGDGNFAPAETNVVSIIVAKGAQSALLVALESSLTYSASPLASSRVTTSGGNGSGTVSYSLVSGPCTLTANELIANSAGDCVVRATKAGDQDFFEKSIDTTFSVAKANQAALLVSLAADASETIAWDGKRRTGLNVAGGSGSGALSVATNSAEICTAAIVNGSVQVTGVAAGSCEVTVTKATSTNYLARSASFDITVIDLPNAPTSVQIVNTGVMTDDGTAVTISWTAEASSGTQARVTGYEVQYKSGINWITADGGLVDADVRTITVYPTPWTANYIRVAPVSSFDDPVIQRSNWTNYTGTSGGTSPVAFNIAGKLETISSPMVAATSGEVVFLTGTDFDQNTTNKVQITTGGNVFTSAIGRAAVSNSTEVKAVVLSPTRLSFVMPKVKIPTGQTQLSSTVRVLSSTGVLSEPVAFNFIPKKLTQAIAVSGLPSGNRLVVGTAINGTLAPLGAIPTVAATTGICSAAINENGAVAITPIAKGSCTVTISAPATPGYTAAAPRVFKYTVAGLSHEITFADPVDRTWSPAPFELVATSSRELPVTFSTTTATVCSISGTTLAMLKAGVCSVRANAAGTATTEVAVPITQSFTISKAARTGGLTATVRDVLGGVNDPERVLTMLTTIGLTAANVSIYLGDNPVDVGVRLNRAEGTIALTVDKADAARCSTEAPGDDPTLAFITVNELGSCKVTISLPADDRWNAGGETIVVWINAGTPPDGVNPTPTGFGDGVEAPAIYYDTTSPDPDSDPAVLLTQTGASVTANLGGDLSMAYDAVTGRYQFRSKTLLVGRYTAKMTGPVGTQWFAQASTITVCTRFSKGKCVRSIKQPTVIAVNECVATLTVKRDPKLKKRVLRIIGSGCQLNETGRAAFNLTGVQNIIFKYQWIRQYPSTGLDHVKKGKTKVRFLKKVKRTVVLSVGRPTIQ